MREQIEVVYANGVLRPLGAIPEGWQEHQHLTVTVENGAQSVDWLADADPTISLEDVREALGKTSDSIANLARAERDER